MTTRITSKSREWKVWVDKDGHITSHRPYIPTSPVEWIAVKEAKPRKSPVGKPKTWARVVV